MSTFQLSEAQSATLQGLFEIAEDAYFSNPGTKEIAGGAVTELSETTVQ